MEISLSSQIIDPQKSMMSISGMWHYKNPSILYQFKTALSYILGAGLTIMMIIQMIYYRNDFMKVTETIFIAATMMSFMIKFTVFRLNHKYFFEILKEIDDPELQMDAGQFNNHLAQAHLISEILTKIYRFVCVACCVTWGIFPLVEKTPLPFPFPYFNSGPMHIPTFAFQWIAINFSGWNNACLDIICTGFMLITGAQLDVLRNKIIVAIDSGTQSEEKLRQCCVHHNKIINFTKNIENLHSAGLLAQFLSSIICICNTGFHFMLISWKSTQFVNLVLYFMAMSSQLTMYCWFGNEIILKSESVGDACYNSKWYNLPIPVKKYIFLIMERSKRPLAISAYKFGYLSLKSFTSVCDSMSSVLPSTVPSLKLNYQRIFVINKELNITLEKKN